MQVHRINFYTLIHIYNLVALEQCSVHKVDQMQSHRITSSLSWVYITES